MTASKRPHLPCAALLAFATALSLGFSSFGQIHNRPLRRPSQPSGGLVYTKAEKKHICVVDAQKTASRAVLQTAIDAVIVHLHMPFAIESAAKKENALDVVRRVKADDSAGAVIAFVEDRSIGRHWIEKNPETGVYLVNLSVLKRGAGKDVLAARLRKMMWRSLAWTLGLDAGGGPSSILDRADTLAELDAISAITPGPMQHNAMVDRLEKRDVKMIKVGTYRTACQQGWAPPPDTDERRTIWQEVNSEKERGPVNGLKIAP